MGTYLLEFAKPGYTHHLPEFTSSVPDYGPDTTIQQGLEVTGEFLHKVLCFGLGYGQYNRVSKVPTFQGVPVLLQVYFFPSPDPLFNDTFSANVNGLVAHRTRGRQC